jgi:CelD/BcsL family acetyltransferase involved in cellulose biosynthesis
VLYAPVSTKGESAFARSVEASAGLSVRARRFAELHEETDEAWVRLESRAVDANAFLSPHFVRPALRHLEPDLDPVVLTASAPDGEMVGLGVFRDRGPSRRFPLRHLGAFRSKHSYLSGWLLDRDVAPEAMRALLGYISAPGTRWHGIVFPHAPADESHGLMLEAATAFGGRWFEYTRRLRATLAVEEAGEPAIERLSAQRRKTLRRNVRQLEGRGPVEWTLRAADGELRPCVERFLALEHSGWKGPAGGSLLSSPGCEAFFRQMVEGFGREGRVFFTELSVGGQVVSSTCNLVSGGEGFAFKIGWDPGYASMSVGTLNEVELMRQAPQRLSHLRRLDSGSEPGSYMDALWAGRRTLVDGVLSTTRAGRLAGRLAAIALKVKRRLAAIGARSGARSSGA